MGISPFSSQHNWEVKWKTIPSYIKFNLPVNINNVREKKALEALTAIGIIGENQLSQLFHLTIKEIERLEKEHMIVRHKLKRNGGSGLPIYTLGVKGAKGLKLDSYEKNYWYEFTTEDILRCLLFFQLYRFFPTLKIIPTPSPFIGAIDHSGVLTYVYIIKGSTGDLSRYLRWDKKRHHRLIIISETLNNLRQLELFLDELKVRVVKENELMAKGSLNKNIFYNYENGELTR